MAEKVINENALPHLIAMILTALFVVFFWVFCRLPGAGKEALMSGIFSTFIAYLIVDPELRTRRLIVSFTVLGAFQFVIAMLLQEKFLLIIFFFMAIMLIVHILPNRALAVMVVAMGSMFVAGPGGVEAGVNHWVFFMLMLPGGFLIIAGMHKLYPVNIFYPPFKKMYGPMDWFL